MSTPVRAFVHQRPLLAEVDKLAIAPCTRSAIIEEAVQAYVANKARGARDERGLHLLNAEEGLKQPSAIHCDALVSLPKSTLTNYVGTIAPTKIPQLNRALAIALGLA